MYVCMYVGGSHGVMQLCYNELQREIPLHKLPYQNQLDPFRRYDTTPVCDRQTDRRTDTRRQRIPRYRIEWRGEGVFVTINFSLRENVTPSTKPEVHDVLQCGQRSTEQRQRAL